MEPKSLEPEHAVLGRVGEVSLRIMARSIPRKTVDRVRALMAAAGEEYPWQQVVDLVLAEPVASDELVGKALRAQRDWFAAATPMTARTARAARVAGKKALAYVLSRVIFFALYTGAVVILLVLMKYHWPNLDIYRLLDWLRTALPGVFRG